MPAIPGAWVVFWPANTKEPVWLFDCELGAKAFARAHKDDMAVHWQPVYDITRARELAHPDPDRIIA